MREFQKQQLLDIITSLHFLHQENKERMVRKEYETVQGALVDCQEAAIQVGEAIERMGGKGSEAVECLEQYCEKVYQISNCLESISEQKAYKILERVLVKAENAINHMQVRKEIVFLPYKASMWDSLESVYLAYKEDKDYDTYVVPIPYYDKKNDGHFDKMYYEGNEYPKNIEITDYKTYNLEERHPDAIFIHNPYDEWNNVTCVPERYFSRNLCRHTSCLVYIPYFILQETKPDDDVNFIKHFCFLPGTIYANKVIVQSENMRQIYINEYIKEAKAIGLSVEKNALEEKILGLGSPKLDKVLYTKREDMKVPEEWRKVIEKPDGTWKRILFYNTSVSALLYGDEKYLEKMRHVFENFKKQCNEIAFLWRPHPLLMATIKSMRPQLQMEYERLVAEYRQEGWGIYDDSADLDRAIAFSDAYYGDRSSVDNLFSECGKNVVFQSVGYNLEIDYSPNVLCCSNNMIIENGCIYFPAKYYDGLCKVDINKRDVNILTGLTEYGFAKRYLDSKCLFLYNVIFAENKKVICFPRYSEFILVCDLETSRIRKIPVPYMEQKRSIRFLEGVKSEGKIYCFFEAYYGIAVFDIDTEKITVFDFSIEKTRVNEKQRCFLSNPVVINDRIYIPAYNENKIWVFNINDSSFEEIYLNNDETGYCSCDYFSHYLCLLSKNRRLIIYDLDTEICEACIEMADMDKDCLGEVFSSENSIWILERERKKISVIECGNGWKNICDFLPENKDIWNEAEIVGYTKKDMKFYILMEQQDKLGFLTIDMRTKKDFLEVIDCSELRKTFLEMQYRLNENQIPVNIYELFKTASVKKAENRVMNCGNKIKKGLVL